MHAALPSMASLLQLPGHRAHGGASPHILEGQETSSEERSLTQVYMEPLISIMTPWPDVYKPVSKKEVYTKVYVVDLCARTHKNM